MKQLKLSLLILLWCCGICAAQQVVSSGGYIERSDISFNWILGGNLSNISSDGAITSIRDPLKELEESPISLKVYPNPVNEFMNVEITTGETDQIILELYNSLGVKILDNKVSHQPVIQVNVSDLPPGAYLLKVLSPSSDIPFKTQKIFKQ